MLLVFESLPSVWISVKGDQAKEKILVTSCASRSLQMNFRNSLQEERLQQSMQHLEVRGV